MLDYIFDSSKDKNKATQFKLTEIKNYLNRLNQREFSDYTDARDRFETNLFNVLLN
jgi:hypothetical protein